MKPKVQLAVLALAAGLLCPEGSRAEQARDKIQADRSEIEGTWRVTAPGCATAVGRRIDSEGKP